MSTPRNYVWIRRFESASRNAADFAGGHLVRAKKPPITPPLARASWWKDPNWLQVVIGVVALFVGTVAVYCGYQQWQEAVVTNERKQDIIIKNQEAIRTRIFQPQNGDAVKQHIFVSGYTPYGDKNNYLFVTDSVGGTKYRQYEGIPVEQNGYWTQPAVIGEAGSCGIEFLITEVATTEIITSPTLDHFPRDAIIAPSIRVTRESCKK
jgi:hypothetical protein